MGDRIPLQKKLEGILGSREVYYQPPDSIKMRYPAIRYNRKDIDAKYANNKIYSSMTAYEIVLIDANPDSVFIQKIMELPFCSYDRHYTAENLNHEVFTLYY